MARFRGTVQGQRGEVARLGHRELVVTCNGWEGGIRVEALPDTKHPDQDTFRVYVTGGSNGRRGDDLLATLTVGKDGQRSTKISGLVRVPEFIGEDKSTDE